MRTMINIDYTACVEPFIGSFTKVTIPTNTTNRIKDFIEELIKYKKQNEQLHIVDGDKEFKRFYTGLLGEAALEIYLDKPIIDYSIGESSKYNVPDIQRLGIGIKTSEYGKFPIIFKKNYYPQIINIKQSDNEILIAGIASVSTLNTYQNEDLILDPNLRKRGTKTAFYGFGYLKNIERLRRVG